MSRFRLSPIRASRNALRVPLLLRILCLTLLFRLASDAKSPEEFVGPPNPGPVKADTPATRPPKGHPPAAKPVPSAKPARSAAARAPKPASNAAPAGSAMALDTAKLHATYLDGDFDKAIQAMEAALKSKRKMSHADSVFIFKHLGVMYAATPATREKGRYYMAQLIYVEPTAKILDMYASDMIYLIFRNVQEEFEHKHPQVAAPAADTSKPVAAAAGPTTVPVASSARPSGSKSKTLYWVTGGAVVAAGAVGLLIVLLDDPKPRTHQIVVPE